MKTSTAILFTLFCGWSFAQTAIIAHKSHSGTAMDFASADPANYGMPSTTYLTLYRVNDTVIATQNSSWGQNTALIINNRELQDSLRDSTTIMRLTDYELRIVLGKDTSAKVIELNYNETPQQRLEQIEKEKPKQAPKKEEKATKSHNKKSSLLYFGLISGASLAFGMLRKKVARA